MTSNASATLTRDFYNDENRVIASLSVMVRGQQAVVDNVNVQAAMTSFIETVQSVATLNAVSNNGGEQSGGNAGGGA